MKLSWTALGLLAFGVPTLAVAQKPEAVPPAFEKAAESDGGHQEEDPFDPDRSAPKRLQVQIEYIELSHEALTKLLFLAKPEGSDAAPLRKQLQQMVEKNEATALETQLIAASSGQKATLGSIHEFIYPTEYEPASGTAKPDDKPPAFPTVSFPFNPATPTAFDTRNVGSNLEAEPTLSEDGRIIDIRLAPELTWHTGDTIWQETKDTLGNISNIRMPDFYTLSASLSISCVNGQYTLLAVQSPKNAKGDTDMSRKVVMFLKCDVLIVK
ncbi:MAG: hypothetical protein V4584_07200 [Verrucomicrobiota bacterium]